VPRHWGRKRKYLQGKRGVEKPPFALPDFIIKTGICDVRDATAEDESKMSIKQKNRMRVSGKGGAMDVDYRTLYEAFFVHQTKPTKLTKFGDLYYEGKEYETTKSSKFRPGYMSERLREALGMANEYSPPPWLINMQRYGPPPSYPNARIPGLNAPLPAGASYGYHVGGWGKPPVDVYGRPLYGGDPFGAPEMKNDGMGGGFDEENEDLYGLSYGGTASTMLGGGIITSDGKALGKKLWGSLPSAFGGGEEEEEEEEESSSEEESSEEEEDDDEQEEEESQMIVPPLSAGGDHVVVRTLGMDSVLPDGVDSVVPSSAVDLRKPGDETPMMTGAVVGGPPRQLYTILQQTSADKDTQQTSVFASDHVYVLPGGGAPTGQPLEGAASVLSKSVGTGGVGEAGAKKRARTQAEDDEADELGKKFKF
jgi:splicing factor 3B subunit 2